MKNGTKGDERLFIIKKLWNKIKKLPRKAERLLGILGEILWILFQKAGRILKKGLQKIPRNPIVVNRCYYHLSDSDSRSVFFF